MTARWVGRLGAAALVGSLVGPGLFAQEQEPPQAAPDSTVEAPRPIPADSIPDHARATASRLVGLPGRVLSDSVLARRDSVLRDLQQAYNGDTAAAAPERLDAMFFDQLSDLEVRWRQLQRRLTSWRERTAEIAGRAESVADTLGREQERWRLTRAASWSDLPQAVREQVTTVRRDLDAAAQALRPLREQLLAMQGTAAQLDVDVTARIDEILAAQDRARRQLFRQDSPVLWKALTRPEATADSAARAGPPDQFTTIIQYLQAQPARLRVHGVLVVLAILAFWLIGRNRDRWATKEFALHWPTDLLAHPIAAGWLLGIALVRSIYPDAPRGVHGIALLVGLPALIILLRQLLAPPLRGPAYALAALYAVRVLADTFAWNPLAARIALLALATGGLAVFLWFSRLATTRLAASPARHRRLRAGRVLAYGGSGTAGLAILGNVFGFVVLADLLITASIATALAALALVALADVVTGATLVALLATPIGRLQVVRRNREAVIQRVTALVYLAGIVFWLSVALRQFRLLQPVTAVLTGFLSTPIGLGSWHFSAADVLLFAITLWLSIFLAGALRGVLRDDILTRMDLDRGAPDAIASIVYYLLLALGFVFAVGAAGIDFSRLALIAGALGVGIGFGLQNIVANFISGLILLFERPIQTGDTLEMEGLRGTVQRIGIRASVVRTFQGADMIVPNQDLIAQRVINWTLSDQTRRVEIPIGVAYGSDPSQVIALIREVAEQHPEAQGHPAVEVLFRAFGESSLDFELRVWTGIDHWLRVQSDILTAVYQAFAEHGIEIPFPQRDLHVRSVDPEVRGIVEGEKKP